MNPFSRSDAPRTAAIVSGLTNLATWLAARSLNVPEVLVHNTGVFVFAQVQAVENRAAKTLCPVRLLRQLRSWLC